MTAHRILRKNSHGEDVRAIQRKLIELGYGALLGDTQDDGKFGTHTREAICQFQRDHYLVDDGVIGNLTHGELDKALPGVTRTRITPKPAEKLTEAAKNKADDVRKLLAPTMPTIAPQETTPTKKLKPLDSDDVKLGNGDIRLAQSYLRVLDCFGNYDQIPAATVVHGKQDKRTEEAVDHFLKKYGKKFDPRIAIKDNDGNYSQGLLRMIREAHDTMQKQPAKFLVPTYSATMLQQLETAFEKEYSGQKHYAAVAKLHPALRFPAMEAITEVEKAGVNVRITDTYRAPSGQEALVKSGVSASPPGYSFHAHGLALDISPADERGNAVFNVKDARWNAINTTMEKAGFYSMFLHDGWDKPHHELPAKTRSMVSWPVGKNGWKEIPMNHVPEQWQAINRDALATGSGQQRTTRPKISK